jgi:hypothetical protein
MNAVPVPYIHITDLFFHVEISQAVGSDAGDAWLLEQRSVCSRKRSQSPKSTRTNTRSALYHHRETGNDRQAEPMGTYQIKATKTQPQLESEIASVRRLLEEDPRLDIGLLYTDAAHSVLHRLGRLNSI